MQDGDELINFASQVLSKSLKLYKDKKFGGGVNKNRENVKGMSLEVQARTR